MARRHRFLPRRGRAAARREPWRHGDQRRDGAGQGRQGKTARSCRQDRGKIACRRSGGFRRGGRARLHQSHLEVPGLDGRTAHDAARGGVLRQERDRPRRQGQCRIRLGQPDRTDACRPLPGRGVRRRAVRPAGFCWLRRHARILHQRCRRAGRCARALGIPALPGSARREHRRDPGRAVSGGLSRAGGAGARGRAWRQAQGDAGGLMAADRARPSRSP